MAAGSAGRVGVMAPVLPLLIILVLLFGFGFLVPMLWYAAGAVVVLWLIWLGVSAVRSAGDRKEVQ